MKNISNFVTIYNRWAIFKFQKKKNYGNKKRLLDK